MHLFSQLYPKRSQTSLSCFVSGSSASTDIVVALCLMLLGLVPRLYLVLVSAGGIESDEAIVGLMAKHIAEGEPWPLFYYGQRYLGSLEALVAAAFFEVFGPSECLLKLVPVLFSLLHIGLVYALALVVSGRFAACAAGLLTALGPSALILWSTKARGGFIELVALGTLSLLLGARVIADRRRFSPLPLFLIGAVLGLGFWVNPQMVYYAFTLGLSLVVLLLRRARTLRRRAYLSFWPVLGILVGGWPLWQAELFLRPRLSTMRMLVADSHSSSFSSQLRGLVTTAAPIIGGARRFWSERDVFTGASQLIVILYLFIAFCLAFSAISAVRRMAERGVVRWGGLGLLLCFVVLVVVIFSASRYGSLALAPRYLLPLYSVLFVLVGTGLDELRRAMGAAGTPIALGMLLIFLSVHAASNYAGGTALPDQPFVFGGQRVSWDQKGLYQWLSQNGYSHIRTNYWIGYRAAFETREKVTFTAYGYPRVLRIPRYEYRDPEYDEYPVYVLSHQEARLLARTFTALGYEYRLSKVAGYSVLDRIETISRIGRKYALAPEQIKATSRNNWVNRMVDNALETSWRSGETQHPRMSIDIDLKGGSVLSAVEIDMGLYIHDAPRWLVIEGENADGTWCQLFDSEKTKLSDDLLSARFDDVPRRWLIVFPPRKLHRIRLLQQASEETYDWSIAELALYEAPHGEAVFMPLVSEFR